MKHILVVFIVLLVSFYAAIYQTKKTDVCTSNSFDDDCALNYTDVFPPAERYPPTAVRAKFRPMWQYDFMDTVKCHKLFNNGNYLLMATPDNLTCLQVSGGNILWENNTKAIKDIVAIEQLEAHQAIVFTKTTILQMDISTGSILWKTELNEPITLSPILKHQNIFVASKRTILCLPAKNAESTTSTIKWVEKFDRDIYLLTMLDNYLFVAAIVPISKTMENTELCLINKTTGGIVWKTKILGRISDTPVIYGNKLYFCTTEKRSLLQFGVEGRLHLDGGMPETARSSHKEINKFNRIEWREIPSAYSIALESGKVLWTFRHGSVSAASPIVSENVIFIRSLYRSTYARDYVQGKKVWQKYFEGKLHFLEGFCRGYISNRKLQVELFNELRKLDKLPEDRPLVQYEHLIIGATTCCIVNALNIKDGTSTWQFNSTHIISTDLLCTKGLIIFGDIAGKVRFIDAHTGAGLLLGSCGTDKITTIIETPDSIIAINCKGVCYKFSLKVDKLIKGWINN